MPPCGTEQGAGVLAAEVSLQHRLEEVADRRDRGDRGADDHRVGSREPVLVKACEPERHRADHEAPDQALERLVRREGRGDLVRAEHPARRVGPGVGREGADQDATNSAAPWFGRPEARRRGRAGSRSRRSPSNVDAPSRRRSRRRCRRSAPKAKITGKATARTSRDVERGAEVRGDHERRDGKVGGALNRAELRRHAHVLAQTEDADRDHRQREDDPPGHRDRDRKGDPGDRDEDPLRRLTTHPATIGAAAWVRAEPAADRPRTSRRRRVPSRLRPSPRSAGAATRTHSGTARETPG